MRTTAVEPLPDGAVRTAGRVASADFERAARRGDAPAFESGRERGREEGRRAEREALAPTAARRPSATAGRPPNSSKSLPASATAICRPSSRRWYAGAGRGGAHPAPRSADGSPSAYGRGARGVGAVGGIAEIRLRVPARKLDLWKETIALLPKLTVKPLVVAGEGMLLGECVIESKVGTVDLGIRSQLGEIERGFFDRAGTPDAPARPAVSSEAPETRPSRRAR